MGEDAPKWCVLLELWVLRPIVGTRIMAGYVPVMSSDSPSDRGF